MKGDNANRIVILNFKNKLRNDMNWPIPRDTIKRIPAYAASLTEAEKLTGIKKRRTTIEDPTQRDEDHMMEVLEFLAIGRLDALPSDRDSSRRPTLTKLIGVCSLASSLKLEVLVNEISTLLSEEPILSHEECLDVAKQCCAAESNIDLTSASPIGSWIHKYLAKHLDSLRAGGYTEKIKVHGGKLANVLIEALLAARAE